MAVRAEATEEGGVATMEVAEAVPSEGDAGHDFDDEINLRINPKDQDVNAIIAYVERVISESFRLAA